MTRITRALCSIVVLTGTVIAASRPHVIAFGKWTSVKWLAGADETSPLELKVRALYVDGKLKEFAIGNPHEITERLFAVRRAFRINDSLPDESVPRWQWQRGGWLLVDRVSGRASRRSISLSSMRIARWRAGIATTSRIAEYPMTIKNFMRW